MNIYNVFSKDFKAYGQVLEGYDFEDFIEVLKECTPMPEQGFLYEASVPELEEHPMFEELQKRAYGGMPIQLGYCNGYNTELNCLEYHKGSEVCIFAYDTILLLGIQSEIESGTFNTKKIKAFLIPAGTGVELYATTLHYAPCSVKDGQGYKVANCLPKGTNIGMPVVEEKSSEDKMLWATNKWLLVHKDSKEAQEGAYIGLEGENIKIEE